MKGFNTVDLPVAQALNRMKSVEMRPLLEFFKNLDTQTKDALIRADSDTFARLQGRATLLQEFLIAVETSADVVEKLR